MRHFILPRTVAPCPRGMVAAAIGRALIAPAGEALFGAPGLLGASPIAIDVAAVAAGTDQHPGAATRAEILARGCMCLFGLSTEAWTNRAVNEILPRHACLGTMLGAAPVRTCRCESAPRRSSTKTAH